MELIGLTKNLSLYERIVVFKSHKDYKINFISFKETCQLRVSGRYPKFFKNPTSQKVSCELPPPLWTRFLGSTRLPF